MKFLRIQSGPLNPRRAGSEEYKRLSCDAPLCTKLFTFQAHDSVPHKALCTPPPHIPPPSVSVGSLLSIGTNVPTRINQPLNM